ncbi:kinase-like domain-containing protein [Dipodascopsis uninucleata]
MLGIPNSYSGSHSKSYSLSLSSSAPSSATTSPPQTSPSYTHLRGSSGSSVSYTNLREINQQHQPYLNNTAHNKSSKSISKASLSPNSASFFADDYRGHTRRNSSPTKPSLVTKLQSLQMESPTASQGSSSSSGSGSPMWSISSSGHLRTSSAMASPSVPKFRRVRSISELHPKQNSHPKHRRMDPDGYYVSPIKAMTSQLHTTYRLCNPDFRYESAKNPRRVLTKPSKGTKNSGYDNDNSDYILYVSDVLSGQRPDQKYMILDILGHGTFGQVVKCQNLTTKEILAVKVIKNKPAYYNQSMSEVSILEHLNSMVDRDNEHHLLRLRDKFVHHEHLCLVFELLSSNLYDLIQQNHFKGLSVNLVAIFARQLLNALCVLKDSRIIHCDLKPENILLENLESPNIKIIDFGSACKENQTVYTYIQSRFYRSPEVILGLPYTSSIDMWSLGCIVAELFLGLPIFPGSSEYNQITRITEMLGMPPLWMIEMGKNASHFFEKTSTEFPSQRAYYLKSIDKYSRERNVQEQPSKHYFSSTRLDEIVTTYPMPRKHMSSEDIEKEHTSRLALLDFVRGLLNQNPVERWTPHQACLHPFITNEPFTGPFVPPPHHQLSHTSDPQLYSPLNGNVSSSTGYGATTRY